MVTMLEKAITYVKFLQLQVKVRDDRSSMRRLLFRPNSHLWTTYSLMSDLWIITRFAHIRCVCAGVGDRRVLAGARREGAGAVPSEDRAGRHPFFPAATLGHGCMHPCWIFIQVLDDRGGTCKIRKEKRAQALEKYMADHVFASLLLDQFSLFFMWSGFEVLSTVTSPIKPRWTWCYTA